MRGASFIGRHARLAAPNVIHGSHSRVTILGYAMGAAQREATWKQPTGRDTALAGRGLACAVACALSLAPGVSIADPPNKETAPASRKGPGPVRLPGHTRDDTGRVADPRDLHGDSKIENADATAPAGERVVRPIPPTLRTGGSNDATEPPPFHDAPAIPAPNYTPPASTMWSTPPMPWTGTRQPEPAAPTTPVPIDAGDPAHVESGHAQPGNARPPGQELLDEKEPTATERAQAALTPAETGRRTSKRKDRGITSTSERAEPALEEAPPIKADEPAVPDVLDQIRVEIKNRLPYFQACADSARRRAGLEIRRLQATWFINADGTIKEFRLDEVPDVKLAACLVRAGSRPFPVQPGVDLAIPTPIVFVR